jgi:hypothetical protein
MATTTAPVTEDMDRPSAAWDAAYADFEDAVRYLEHLQAATIDPLVLAERWTEQHPGGEIGPRAVATVHELQDLLAFLVERLYDARRLAAHQAHSAAYDAERRDRRQAGRGALWVAVGFALTVLADHLLVEAMRGLPHLFTGGQG